MIVGFLSGLFIGSVAGATVMTLCQAAKERDELWQKWRKIWDTTL